MAEFHANAVSRVGNFSGPCIIFLNGEAITVKQENGVEIAKWPYNCIRQFKAEDETGKFSFVSGRRGPYGVAEYNFGLDDVSQLQHALSQFTGAQFNQTPSSQPPLPPLPPIPHGGRLPSVSSIGRYSIGSRTDSIENVFTSPGHTRVHAPPPPGPKLPPRDYLHNSISGSSLSDSLHSSGGYAFARTRNSTSASDILDSSSCVPQPSVDGGSGRGVHVMSNEHYHHQRLLAERSPQTKAKQSSLPKRSPLTQSSNSESKDEVAPELPPRESPAIPKTTSTGSLPPQSTSATDKQLKKQRTEPAISKKPSVSPKPTIPRKPQRLMKHNEVPPSSQSPSPEHLKEKEEEEGNLEGRSAGPTPEPSQADSGPTSPVPDTADLDRIPRSSPQVSRTLRSTLKGRQSPIGKLVKSTTTPALHSETYDVPKSLQTQSSVEEGDGLYNNVSLLGEEPESEDTYQVPRPTVDSEYHVPRLHDDVLNEERYYHHPKPVDEVYKVPRPMSGMYSSLLGKSSDNVYSSPRPPVATRSPQGVYYSYPPDADGNNDDVNGQRKSPPTQTAVIDDVSGQLYSNVTLTAPPKETGGDSEENFYNVPRPGEEHALQEQREGVVAEAAAGDDGLYNVPRSLSNQREGQSSSPPKTGEDLYKVPRRLSRGQSHQDDDDGLYKMPRSVKQSGSESPPPRNPYETVDLDRPRVIRPARSLESLHRVRTLPPRSGNRYVDLNVTDPSSSFSSSPSSSTSSRPLPSSTGTAWIQNQPLPPRPTQNLSTDDNLYAEIPEDLLSKVHVSNSRSPPGRGHDNLYVAGPEVTSDTTSPVGRPPVSSPYDKLPPRRPSPEVVAIEGVAKAKELAKQGYELCLPTGEDPRLKIGRTAPIATPPRNIPRRNFSSLEKYDIKIPAGMSSRTHRSESGPRGPLTPDHSDTVLASSIPSDSTKLSSDEYVIITRRDTRLKHSHTFTATPSSVTSTGSAGAAESGNVLFPEGDEYEQMNPIKSQLLLNESLHYSTPNPSLYHNGDNSATADPTPSSTAAGTVGGADDHLYGNVVEHTDKDSSNLDRPQLVRSQTLPPRRKTFSSSSTDSDVFMSSHPASGPSSIPEFVRVTSESAEESSGLPKRRLHSGSDDNILENGSDKPKRHSYVNVTSDTTESSEQQDKPSAESVESASQPGPPKKPKPFPRSSLLRMESEEQK